MDEAGLGVTAAMGSAPTARVQQAQAQGQQQGQRQVDEKEVRRRSVDNLVCG